MWTATSMFELLFPFYFQFLNSSPFCATIVCSGKFFILVNNMDYASYNLLVFVFGISLQRILLSQIHFQSSVKLFRTLCLTTVHMNYSLAYEEILLILKQYASSITLALLFGYHAEFITITAITIPVLFPYSLTRFDLSMLLSVVYSQLTKKWIDCRK